MCTAYLQPEHSLSHVGVLEVGRAGVPGILRDAIVQVNHLSPTHLQEEKEAPHQRWVTVRKDYNCLKQGKKPKCTARMKEEKTVTPLNTTRVFES